MDNELAGWSLLGLSVIIIVHGIRFRRDNERRPTLQHSLVASYLNSVVQRSRAWNAYPPNSKYCRE
jgi:hypothetical protein